MTEPAWLAVAVTIVGTLWVALSRATSARITALETQLAERDKTIRDKDETIVRVGRKFDDERDLRIEDAKRAANAIALRATPQQLAEDDFGDMPTGVHDRLLVARNAVTAPPQRPDGRYDVKPPEETTPTHVVLGPPRRKMPSTRG